MFAAALLLAAAVGAPENPPLPQRLGAFGRGEIGVLRVAPGERALYDEYGFRAAYRADYMDGQGRRMTVESLRFLDSEGAHAAYLCSRPVGGVSPMIWNIDAVTGGGATVVEFHNYMLRFHGALPSISSHLEEMLAALPSLAADAAPWDVSGRYLDKLSTRAILGPVSLERFAPKIPPSVAGFRLGAKGRTARFETPAGAVTEVVFEYPTEDVAQNRAEAVEALPSATVRVEPTCASVIFEPVDPAVAKELQDEYFCGPVGVDWDPATMWDGPMTLGDGLSLMLWGFVVGAVFAGTRQFAKAKDPFPNRMIFLQL